MLLAKRKDGDTIATKSLISDSYDIPVRVLGVEQTALLKEPTVASAGRITGESFLYSYGERKCILHTLTVLVYVGTAFDTFCEVLGEIPASDVLSWLLAEVRVGAVLFHTVIDNLISENHFREARLLFVREELV